MLCPYVALEAMNSITQSDPGVNGSPVRLPWVNGDWVTPGQAFRPAPVEHIAEPAFSSALWAANAHLQQRRQGLAAQRRPAAAAPTTETVDPATPMPALPPHLGWGSRSAPRAGVIEATSASSLRIVLDSDPPTTPQTPASPVAIRAYPALLTGFLKTGQAATGRVWLLGRSLDTSGQGWVTVSTLREGLTGRGSARRLCGWRRLRQVLQAGEGIFWQRDRFGRIWFTGVARLAAHLGVTRLTGHPISLPVDAILGDIGHWRAHCYTAYHSSRAPRSARYGAPISRASLTRLTRVPGRTQRHYERLTRLARRSNLAVGGRAEAAARQEHAWRHGRAVFSLTDRAGRRGPAGASYLAWRLPNQYAAGHAAQAVGRCKKINRWLRNPQTGGVAGICADLVITRERGNTQAGQTAVGSPIGAQLRYCRHARHALHTLKRTTAPAVYWPAPQTTQQGRGVWHVVAAGP